MLYSWSPLLLHYLLSLSLCLWLRGECSIIIWQREIILRQSLQMVGHSIKTYQEAESCSNTVPFIGITDGQWRREILPVGRTLDSAPGCLSYLKGEMGRHMVIYWCLGYGQRFNWVIRDLEGTWLEIWWQRNLGMYVDRFLCTGKKKKMMIALAGVL